MISHYYYQVLRKTIIQFLDLFNDIQISRDDKYVEVPLKLGGKEKVWYWINERKDDQMLPMMSAYITSIDFASDRLVNTMQTVTKSSTPSAGSYSSFSNPTPYDIQFTLSIWTLHLRDADEILEQILPYFTPTIYMRVKISELDGTFDVPVTFQSCAPDISNEMPDEENRVVMWNLDFRVQTYMFRPVSDSGMIKKIITKFYTNDSTWAKRGTYKDGSTETTFTSGASGNEAESIYIEARHPWHDADGDVISVYERFD
jgi:hypothetical protein